MPLLQFQDTCPVYFDRHTLSVKDGHLSMYTLDGRIRFHLALQPDAEASFHEKKLREIVLARTPQDQFELSFWFSQPQPDESPAADGDNSGEIPEYIMVEETA